MAKVTNKDIARKAGVSPAAVSIAIHGKRGISEETRAHIMSIVEEMSYVPPATTKGIVQGDCIAVLVNGVLSVDELILLNGVLWAAFEQGLELRLVSSSECAECTFDYIQGVNMAICFENVEESTLRAIQREQRRIVCIDTSCHSDGLFSVYVDYAMASAALTEYLVDLGHREIVYVNMDLSSRNNLLCLNGFQHLLMEKQIVINPNHVITTGGAEQALEKRLAQVIEEENASAILCTSAQAALTVMAILTKQGLHVPQDISVATICASSEPPTCFPKLTCVCLDKQRIGREAVALLKKPAKYVTANQIMLSPMTITPGKSTAFPRYNPTQKKLAIALRLKDHPIFRMVRAGFLKKVEQLGYQAEVVGISDSDDDSYRNACLELINMKVDGAVIWRPIPDVVKTLDEHGILIVDPCFDALQDGNASIRACICVDYEKIAQHVAQFFADHLESATGYIALSQTNNNNPERATIQHFKRFMKELCPNIQMLESIYFDHNDQHSLDIAIDVLKKNRDVIGVYTTTGTTCCTWAAAKRLLNRPDMVIVGTDYTEETIELVKNGEVHAFVAQPLYEESQLSVVALDALLRGRSFPFCSILDAPLVTEESLDKYDKLVQEVKNWYV